MKGHYITLECTACGAPLSINIKADIVKCKYCGFSHQLSNLLKANSLCPICNKDDRVEKASGVLKFRIEDFWVPHFVNLSEKSGANKKKWGNYLILFSTPFLIGRIFINEIPVICFGGSIIALITALFLFYLARKDKLHAQKTNAYHRREMNKAVSANHKEFNRLKTVYNILYYCHRDRIIFLPNGRDYAHPNQLRKFLNKHAEK